ncbi:UNVERIFIED_CONTAM: hypothetical protein GTU68_064169 [Idotea baltica]|nr:hypothetical protein [Idotea baltica]
MQLIDCIGQIGLMKRMMPFLANAIIQIFTDIITT